jgi:lactate dehydrogenase-like 2-hydroxyacid dehydrogenase
MVEYGAEFGRLDKELIDLLPKSLKVIAAGGAGFDWADTEELGRRGPLRKLQALSVRDLVYQWRWCC